MKKKHVVKHRKKWNPWSIFCFTGIPWVLILILLGLQAKYELWKLEGVYRYPREFVITEVDDIKWILYIAAAFWVYILLVNGLHAKGRDRPIGLFTWLTPFKYEPKKVSKRKEEALHPEIDKELLSNTTDGLVLGKYEKKYLRVPLKKGNILNAVILGSAGCGKSSLLLTTLIHQLNLENTGKAKDSERMTFYVTDIKPELAMKSCDIRNDPRVHVMDPQDRSLYGWNVYYDLKADSSDDEVLEELDVIARALIDEGKNEKNAFFYQHARTIFKAVLLYRFRQGDTFMKGLDYLMTGGLTDVVEKTIRDVEERPEYRMVYKLLSPYVGKEGEAMEGIELSLRQSLDIFTQSTIMWFLDNNPRKASPIDLEKRISVFFSIHESKLEEYRSLLRLVTNQIIHHCSMRPESSHMLTLVIDEAARIGLDWTSFLSTSRSRQVSTILAFQSISQAEDIWGKEKTKSLLELCRITAVLSCTDPDMAEMFSKWIGNYKEEKFSVNYGGTNEGAYSSSFEDKRILEANDIMTLQEQEEILLFIKGKFYRTDLTGARYFKIPQLNEISQKWLKINERS